MSDRENSPAYQMLPRSACRVFAAIERAIGDGSSASVSYVDFRLDHHIARRAISRSLKLLDHLGLIDIEPGPRLVNVFWLSNRWRTVDEVEAVRLAALAREVRQHRRFEKLREPKSLGLAERSRRSRRRSSDRASCSGGCRHCRRCRGRTTGDDRRFSSASRSRLSSASRNRSRSNSRPSSSSTIEGLACSLIRCAGISHSRYGLPSSIHSKSAITCSGNSTFNKVSPSAPS